MTAHEMTALEWLKSLPRPWSHETHGPASNSDLRRWLERGSVQINGIRPKPYDELGDRLDEVVFFPKKPERRVTLWNRACQFGTLSAPTALPNPENRVEKRPAN